VSPPSKSAFDSTGTISLLDTLDLFLPQFLLPIAPNVLTTLRFLFFPFYRSFSPPPISRMSLLFVILPHILPILFLPFLSYRSNKPWPPFFTRGRSVRMEDVSLPSFFPLSLAPSQPQTFRSPLPSYTLGVPFPKSCPQDASFQCPFLDIFSLSYFFQKEKPPSFLPLDPDVCSPFTCDRCLLIFIFPFSIGSGSSPFSLVS